MSTGFNHFRPSRWGIMVFFIGICQFASVSMGATYYVKPSGNDNNNGLSEGQAWQHVQKACATLVAGDTVYIRAGVYDENSPDEVESVSESWSVNAGLRPARSGSSYLGDGQIVFKGYPGEMPIIKGIPASGSNGGRVGAWLDDRSYITFDSLYFHYGWFGIMLGNSSGITIKNCKIDSISCSYDNGAGIGNVLEGGSNRSDWTDSLWVINCDIGYVGKYGNYGGTGQFGCIEFYPGFCIYLENNRLHNSAMGIYLKGGNPHSTGSGHPVVISNNVIYDCYELNMYLGNGGKWSDVHVYNNILYNNGICNQGAFSEAGGLMGIAFPSNSDTAHALVNAWIYNNTFDCTGGFAGIRSQDGDMDSVSIFNNIFYNSPMDPDAGEYKAAIGIDNQRENPERFYEDYNLYYGRSDHVYYVYPHGSEYNISQWRASSPNGVIAGHGMHSMEFNPEFLGAADHNYRIESNSPASAGGRGDYWPYFIGAFESTDHSGFNLLFVLDLIKVLYGDGIPSDPGHMRDINGDCDLNLLDILYLIIYVYGNPPGPAPLDICN